MTVHEQAVSRGPVWAAQLFLLSLLLPFNVPVGPILLIPHRLVLLVLFVPFFVSHFILRRSGPVIVTDWLLFAAALWAGLALWVNHGFGLAIEPFGVFMLEFFGAYLLARVTIRSGQDFRSVIRTFFLVVLFLVPFAAFESVAGRPILLDILPGSIRAVDAGDRLGMRRAQTVFVHPILFGVFVSTGLGLFWYALFPRWFRFPAWIIVAAGTVFSLSTGALMSFVAQSGFILWEAVLRKVRRRWLFFSGLAILAYVTVDLLSNRTPFHVLVTYATFSVTSSYNRIHIWRYGTDNVWENPVFGLGLNDWSRPIWMSSSVDNFWLLLTMQYGLPAIILVVTALILILRRVSLVALPTPLDRLCRAGYLVAFGGLCLAGGTVHYWHAMMAFVMFIYGSGVWMGVNTKRLAEQEDRALEAPAPHRSPYTRQSAAGVPIGAEPIPAPRAERARRAAPRASE